MSNTPLVLASSSSARKTQLARLGQPFECWSPDIDESPTMGETPIAMVERLSIEKAQAGEKRFPKHLLIAGDQVQEVDGVAYGKPHTHEEAVKQLQRVSGKKTAFHSGLCVLNTGTGSCHSTVVSMHVTFKTLSLNQIETYLKIDEPYQCAGSLKAEGIGLALLDKVESSDPSDLLGLPLITLIKMLEKSGYVFLPK